MKGQDLAGKGESWESHNATSYLRRGAETERLIKRPGSEGLDPDSLDITIGMRAQSASPSLGLDRTRDQRRQSFKPNRQSSRAGRGRAQR